jgi:hypothetical protein
VGVLVVLEGSSDEVCWRFAGGDVRGARSTFTGASLCGSYLIDRGLEEDGYDTLKALVAEYVARAAELDAIPMETSVVRRYLEQLAA